MAPRTEHRNKSAAGYFTRPAVPLLLALAGPVALTGLLLLIPGIRDLFRNYASLATMVVVAVMIAALIVAIRYMMSRNRQLDDMLAKKRDQWAAARGWRYAPAERLIEPDALTEVDSRLHPEPVAVMFEASGSFQGRRAFVHSRDTWVRFRTAVGKARREVVGVESSIELPRLIVESVGSARRMLVIADRAERAAQRRAEGLTSLPGPEATGTALWVPPGLESRLQTVLTPVLQQIQQVLGTEQVILACQGRWVLVSVPDDVVGDRVDQRLTYASQVAEALERGARPT